MEFDLKSLGSSFSYQFPLLSSELTSVSVSGYEGIQFDKSTMIMSLTPVEGDHEILIVLTSESGLQSNYTLSLSFKPEKEE